MKYIELEDINEYKSESINPAKMQEMVFELYSVPVYETGHPEYLTGKQIASSKIVVRKNDILLCKINPRINRVWIVKKESENVNIASSEWIVVRSNKYNPEFLAWYFRSPQFRQLMVSEVTGIGGSLTRAQPKRVAKYPVPVIDRNIQDKIVYRLNKIYNIIDMKKRELAKFDSLIQARFIELFGDPKYNALKWPIYMLGDLFTIGSSKRIYQSEQVPEGIPFLRISDLMNKIEKADESANLFISEELYEELQERDLVPVAGDILVTSRGTLGQCYEIKEQDKFYFQDGMISWLYNRDEKITNNYLMFLFQMPGFRLQIDEVPEGSTVNYLSIARLKNLRIMCPSIELQQQFAAFVVKVNKSKFVIHKFLYCTTHNTQSIIKPRPNTKESGKTRGGKPYADEF